MTPTTSIFDRWAADRLEVPVERLRLSTVLRGLPRERDLPDGGNPDMGGEVVAAERDEPTETEEEQLAALADELVAEFPDVPEDYEPPDKGQPLRALPSVVHFVG